MVWLNRTSSAPVVNLKRLGLSAFLAQISQFFTRSSIASLVSLETSSGLPSSVDCTGRMRMDDQKTCEISQVLFQ